MVDFYQELRFCTYAVLNRLIDEMFPISGSLRVSMRRLMERRVASYLVVVWVARKRVGWVGWRSGMVKVVEEGLNILDAGLHRQNHLKAVYVR